jgi:effector-binding domain-containing protein
VHVERSITVERPPATVFAVVNSYRSFAAWSPWADRDPGAVYEFSGPESGPGARLSWTGDPRLVGSGWQEIIESRPPRLVRMQLDFEQQGTARAYFQLDPTGAGTRVTWGFDTDLVEDQGWLGGLLARYFGLFFDTWIGTDYEQGLTRLKTYVESLPPADFSGLDVDIVEAEAVDILYVDSDADLNSADLNSADLTASLAEAYREITAYMAARNIERAAQPLAITRVRPAGGYQVEAAIPVVLPEPAAGGEESSPAAAGETVDAGRVRTGRSPAGRAVRAVHRGPYDRMGPTYEQLAAWMAAHGVEEGEVSWEQYISDPGETPPQELITHIYFLIADDD